MTHQTSYSLYMHIPFCRQRCSYCDFNTYTTLGDLKVAYTSALADEIEQVSQGVRRSAHTVYMGGGTPSIMPVEQIEVILRAINDGFLLEEQTEITLEANPDTVDRDYLFALKQLGVNRLSFGAQSADKDELALLGREHDFTTVIRAMEFSRVAGFEDLNLDLIYGLPDQSLLSWELSIRAALELEPAHLSLYCLTIEDGTPMQRWLRSGTIKMPDPDTATDQFDLACDLLAAEGFNHYEISNWARPGRECRHNLSYWRNDQYLGFGAGAHGHAAGYRYWVVRQPRTFIRRMAEKNEAQFPWSSAVAGWNKLSRRETMSDVMITRLRLLNEGLDFAAFQDQFGLRPDEVFPGVIEQLMDFDLLFEEDGRLLLTKRGWFLSNQVFYRFM
jgi:oxygen-independent coproporphyrinogen-3 oxidase